MLKIIFLLVGFVVGIVMEKIYEYHKIRKDFDKRQERYRKMI